MESKSCFFRGSIESSSGKKPPFFYGIYTQMIGGKGVLGYSRKNIANVHHFKREMSILNHQFSVDIVDIR